MKRCWTRGNSPLFSGRPATIDRNTGGAFSLFSDHSIGRNLELVPGQRIVQAWQVVDWPEGTWYPDGLHDHLAAGWQENYWALLAKYFQ